MNAILLETHRLDNGTTLHLFDASRRQAADRWIVVLEARLEISLDDAGPALPDSDGGLTLGTIRQVLGSPVVYVSRRERVFVDDVDKGSLLEALRADFRRTSLPYLAHPDFPARFLRKQYQEVCRRQSWQAAAADPDATVPTP